MPLSNSLYAWLLALLAYGTIDLKDYTLLHTNEKGYSFYVDETDNFIINESIDNPLIAYNLTTLNNATNSWKQFLIGIKSPQGKLIAGLIGWIHEGIYQGVKSDINCEIGLIWVDQEYRNLGLGTLLLNRAEIYAANKGCRNIKASVQQIDNATGFFEKMGFTYKVIKPSPKHFKHHDVYEVMCKDIITPLEHLILSDNFTNEGYQIYSGQPLDHNKTPIDVLRFASAMSYQDIAKSFIDPIIKFIRCDEVKILATYLQEQLTTYRVSQGGSSSVNKFTIFIVSPDKKIIGGAIGEVENFAGFGNWLNIHDVGIDEHYRKHNLGRGLFEQIDAYARTKHCKYLELWTGQWQARGFYEKCGLEVITTFPPSEHDWNQESYILRKYLE